MNFDSTRVKIDLDAISANFDAIRAKAGVDVMAVVKADAYGHGAVQVTRLLQDKCAFFGVSSILEAMELRRLVRESDEKAFLIITDAHDVYGKGFTNLDSKE